MVAILFLLSLIAIVLGVNANKFFLKWRAYARHRDEVSRLQLAYNTMNDGGTKRWSFGKNGKKA